jgi:hypothetical protein
LVVPVHVAVAVNVHDHDHDQVNDYGGDLEDCVAPTPDLRRLAVRSHT